jgi:hypothetical protein
VPNHPVIDAADQFRDLLLRMERAQAMRFVNAYGQIYTDLQGMIEALTVELAGMDEPKAWQVARLARWKELRQQIVEQIDRYGAFVDTELRTAIERQIALGLQHAEQLTLAGIPQPMGAAISSVWNRLPAEAVLRMIGFLAPASPLHQALVEQLGEAVAAGVEKALLQGIALGYNPRKVASMISRELGQGLTWALRTARTAQLWAYREATRAAYVANSDIVEGWIWHAKLGDGRTCISCIVQHGTLHPITETLNDHHNGRCAMVPQTVSWETLGFEGLPDTRVTVPPGRDWFETLSDGEQRRIMGKAKWDAWKAGQIAWDDLSAEHEDEVYGTMRVEASLRTLLGDDADKFYREARRRR